MERFGNIISSARFHGENSILNFCIAGHDDERNGVIVFFEPLQKSEPIMIRESEVGQDQVPVTVVFKKMQCRFHRSRSFNLESLFPEPCLYHGSES